VVRPCWLIASVPAPAFAVDVQRARELGKMELNTRHRKLDAAACVGKNAANVPARIAVGNKQ
jgi:hypothetical protein